jgi:hypothetical protein
MDLSVRQIHCRRRQGLEPLEEWPPFPTEQLRPALHRSVWASLRELATLTVRLPPKACCCDCMS